MEEVLGSKTLLKVDGTSISVEEGLKDKDVLGLYFSAHWCPPCKRFTPELSAFYKKYGSIKKLEIVFVSSDKDAVQFTEYFGSMPWLALPYDNRAAKNTLSKKYKVKGIPSLVLLDAKTGQVLTTNGREGVTSNDTASFPWKPKTITELLDSIEILNTKEGPQAFKDVLPPTKHILLYFSAHWCPPCRAFTPQLAKWYEESKESKNLEIIFCSSDKNEESYNDYYFNHMPSWMALPFSASSMKEALSQTFEVQGIPTLIALGPAQADGNRPIITKDGRACVSAQHPFPEGWLPQPYADLSTDVDCKGSDINDTESIIVLLDHVLDKAAQANAVRATKDFALREADNKDILVFFATKCEGPAMRLRELLKSSRNDSSKAFLIKMNLSEQGEYYTSVEFNAADLSPDNIQTFLENSGERFQINK